MSAPTGLAQAIGDASSGAGRLYVPGLVYGDASRPGVNVFEEALPQSPDVAVAIKSFGGQPPDARLPYDQLVLQLLIRGDQDPATARDLWYLLFSTLQGAVQETLPDGTFLILATVLQGGPINIGPDANGRHRVSMNLALEVVSPTDRRPPPDEIS